MKKSLNCVVGLREANVGSGVGLFNRILADRLNIRNTMLDEYEFAPGEHPMFSLKFGELSSWQQSRLQRELVCGSPTFSLFLHKLDQTELEKNAIQAASHVLCGNDAIYRTLQSWPVTGHLVRAFAPTLIPEEFQVACRPTSCSAFTFGMAGKLDRRRFERLRRLTESIESEFTLFGSFAVHQTSDGSCLPQAVECLQDLFGKNFIYLGTLNDQGIAYLLNTCPIFVGFYRDGVRANNTTFNTAVHYGSKIITNLDENSPPEVRCAPQILNIDHADAEQLQQFIDARFARTSPVSQLFGWDRLISMCEVLLSDNALGSRAA